MTKRTRTGVALLLAALLPAAALGQEQHPHAAQPGSGSGHQGMMGMHGAPDVGDKPSGGGMMGQCGGMMGQSMPMEMMPGMMMDMTPGMMGGSSPSMILRHGEALGLEPDQVSGLQALASQAATGRESHLSRMKEIRAELAATLGEDDVDVDQYEAVLGSMADEMVAMHVRKLRLGQQALQLLTEEQRAKLGSGQMMNRPSGRMEGMTGHGDMAGHPCGMTGGATGAADDATQ